MDSPPEAHSGSSRRDARAPRDASRTSAATTMAPHRVQAAEGTAAGWMCEASLEAPRDDTGRYSQRATGSAGMLDYAFGQSDLRVGFEA